MKFRSLALVGLALLILCCTAIWGIRTLLENRQGPEWGRSSHPAGKEDDSSFTGKKGERKKSSVDPQLVADLLAGLQTGRYPEVVQRAKTREEIAALIEGILGAPEVFHVSRYNALESLLAKLSQIDPIAAARMLDQVANRLQDKLALTNWLLARVLVNPYFSGAEEWYLKNSWRFAETTKGRPDLGLVSRAANESFADAFDLIGRLGIKDQQAGFAAVARGVLKPEQKTGVWQDTLNRAGALEDPVAAEAMKRAVLEGLGNGLAGTHRTLSNQVGARMVSTGFDEQRTWLESVGFSTEELQIMADSLGPAAGGADQGQWLEWMAETATPDKVRGKAAELFTEWLLRGSDREAPLKWIEGQPEGEARAGAIDAYISQRGASDPEGSVKLIGLLPEGPDREALLEKVKEAQERN